MSLPDIPGEWFIFPGFCFFVFLYRGTLEILLWFDSKVPEEYITPKFDRKLPDILFTHIFPYFGWVAVKLDLSDNKVVHFHHFPGLSKGIFTSEGIFTITISYLLAGLKIQGWYVFSQCAVFQTWYIGIGFMFSVKMWLDSEVGANKKGRGAWKKFEGVPDGLELRWLTITKN